MKYVIQMTDVSQDGAMCGKMYYLAETEAEMERMINTFKEGYQGLVVTCLGPITTPNKWMQERISEHI